MSEQTYTAADFDQAVVNAAAEPDQSEYDPDGKRIDSAAAEQRDHAEEADNAALAADEAPQLSFTVPEPALPYVIVRTYSAGCFAGELVARTGQEVTLRQARRLWSWAGAASLSELAARGTSRSDECRFPAPVDITLLEAIEVITVTAAARANIEAVPVWSA